MRFFILISSAIFSHRSYDPPSLRAFIYNARDTETPCENTIQIPSNKTLLSSHFILHSRTLSLNAVDQTSTISNDALKTTPLFTLLNASFSLFSGRLIATPSQICSADEQSVFSLKNTLCDISTESPVFSVAGILQLTSIQLKVKNSQFHSSLIASSPSPRECIISEATFQDACVTTRSPFFGSHFEVLYVAQCDFQNVSQPSNGKDVEARKTDGQNSLILGSSISNCENGLYGLLIRDANDHHQLTSLNSTFFDNIRTFTPVYVNAAPIENTPFTTRQISTANDVTFKKCTFTSCSAPTGEHGGAIFHDNKGSLAIDGCTFTSCRASFGSAVYGVFRSRDDISGLFRLTGSHVDRCGSATDYCAVFIEGDANLHIAGTFLFQNNNFTHMQSLSRVGFCSNHLGGGTIHNCRFVNLTVTESMQAAFKVEGANGDISTSDCYFCEMLNYTSGVAHFQFVYGQTKVERLRFVECHPNFANSHPALIIASRTSPDRPNNPAWYTETPDDNPVVSDCWFEATDMESLSDLNVDVFPEMKQTSVTEIWSTSNPFAIQWEGTAIDTIRQTPDIVIDAVEGSDEEFCWMGEKGCQTMSETINDRTSNKFEGTFLLSSDSHSDSGVVVGQRKLVMKSQSETKATISDEGSSTVLFSISTGSLTLSSVDFSPHIQSSLFVLCGDGELKVTNSVIDGSSLGETELSKPLLELKGGTTTLISLTLQSLTSSVGLIAATSGSDFSLVISKSTLSALTRRVGSGVVVEGRMGSASTVSISESKFTECHTLDEDYVEHDDPANPGPEPNVVNRRGGSLVFSGSTVNAGTVELTSSNFSDCSCVKGSGASLNMQNLSTLTITSCRFENQFTSGYRTQGGAVSGWFISDVTIKASFFKTCRLSDDSVLAQGGAITFQQSQSQTDLCKFEDCSASYAAHGVHLAHSSFTNQEKNCESAADGGAVAVTLRDSASLEIHSTSFHSCSSGGNGGGIWIDASSSPASFTFSLLKLDFGRGSESNKCGASKSGSDVFILGGNLRTLVDATKWEGTLEKAQRGTLCGWDEENGEVIDILSLFRGKAWIVSGSGNDEEGIGSAESPFRTVWRGLGAAEESGEEEGCVEIVGSASIGRRVEIVGEEGREKKTTLSGSVEDNKIVCSLEAAKQHDQLKREEGMIVLTRHTLNIVSISIVLTPTPLSVLVVKSNAQVSLSECKVSGDQTTHSMLVVVHSKGVVKVLSLMSERMKMGGKGSIVIVRGGAMEMEDSSFSGLETQEGGVVWGQTRERITLLNSNFTYCRGEEFGSVVRVTATDCKVIISKCRFVECWTGVGMKTRDTGRREGGGSVLIDLRERKRGGPCSVDLSMSIFTNCVLENTDSSVDEARCVGGSGFLVLGNGPRQRLDLSGMTMSDCSCRNVKMADGFDGGVIGWRTQPLHTDRRDLLVKNCKLGVMMLAN